ncbi:MAG TPA: glycosyltransferase family 9 protein [Castellaniella sp.]|nr:glycosyltransferase family 9 protein [Castellaniella sp.]
MMDPATFWKAAPRRIAVFRALNLGDFLCAVPALRMLRRAAPAAKITLIGLASVRSCLPRFRRYIDDFVEFPGDPEFPEQAARLEELPAFYRAMRERRFDLALQMHGSGARSNAIVERLGARQWAGFVPGRDGQTPWRMAWPDTQPEILRYLLLLQYLGVPGIDDTGLEFPLDAEDQARADALAARLRLDLRRTVFMHPGARLASRRWLPDRFALVGQRLGEDGWRIGVTGSEGERALTASVAASIGKAALDLGGRTDLGALASLLQRGRLLICNDTGVSHVAAAVRAPSVVIASGSDVSRWAPLDETLHSVLHVDMPCRPCAYDRCPVPGHPCARRIGAEEVLRMAQGQLARGGRS